MTEDEARDWVVDRFGTAAAERIGIFVDQVIAENAVQNLISPSSCESIWVRHVVDSAQLLTLAPQDWQRWLDVGTGGGFPGMIVALLADTRSVMMVEPRSKRAAFLQRYVERSGLIHATVLACRVEALSSPADVISARAVASTESLLRSAAGCAKPDTTWLLPRGRTATEMPPSGSVVFHVEHSVTDPASIIHVGKGRPQ